MKSFGFTLLVFIIIVGLCIGGYFAYKSMTSPSSYVPSRTEMVGDLHNVTSNPDTGTTNAAGANASSASTTTSTAPAATTAPTTAATSSSTSTTTTTSSNNASLSASLKTLIANKTTISIGAKGASVGYLEQFTNLYFKKSSSIDNDFGKTLQANIITFQKQNKLSATGTVGTSTLQMMVLWLQNN